METEEDVLPFETVEQAIESARRLGHMMAESSPNERNPFEDELMHAAWMRGNVNRKRELYAEQRHQERQRAWEAELTRLDNEAKAKSEKGVKVNWIEEGF